MQGEWKLVVLRICRRLDTTLGANRLIFIISTDHVVVLFYCPVTHPARANALAAAYEQQQMQLRAKQNTSNPLSDALPLAIFQITQNKRYDHWSYFTPVPKQWIFWVLIRLS